MYKFKYVKILFPRDLSEKQENILIVNFRAVKEATREAFTKASNQLGKRRFDLLAMIPGVGAGVNIARARTGTLTLGVDDFFKLDKTDNRTYYFGYAWEDIRALNLKLKLLGQNINLPEPSLIREGDIITGLNKFVLPAMGFIPKDVSITVTDEAPEGI